VAPVITGTHVFIQFTFHIRCISLHKLLYFSFFSASLSVTFPSSSIATNISMHVLAYYYYYYYSISFNTPDT
jgi:hypothetical protein